MCGSRTDAIFYNNQYKAGVGSRYNRIAPTVLQLNCRSSQDRGTAPPAAAQFVRLALKALFCCLISSAVAQSGPGLEPRQTAQTPAQSDKEKEYLLLDQIRAAIRNDDWAEASRLSTRLNMAIFSQRPSPSRISPDLELDHVELMAGKDATTRTALLPRLARTAFGAHQWQKAESYANETIEAARHGEFWWTGDAVHQGNIVLGRLALARDDVQAADRYLLEAGKAPKSMSLTTFGPNMALARGLLERGERDVVIQYLEECRALWTADRGKLAEWLALARAGLKPDFGPNVDY